MISYTKLQKRMTGWHEVMDSTNISDLREWQHKLEDKGAITLVTRCQMSGGRYGPKRAFVLWTDPKGAKVFEYEEEEAG